MDRRQAITTIASAIPAGAIAALLPNDATEADIAAAYRRVAQEVVELIVSDDALIARLAYAMWDAPIPGKITALCPETLACGCLTKASLLIVEEAR